MTDKVNSFRFLINQAPAYPRLDQVPSHPGTDFRQLLNKQIASENRVKFSRHASMRLQQRSITLSPLELEKISLAMDKAGEKGASDALVLMNNLALVVNVPNRTVITALDGESIKNNVFTKIDSAVVI